jgi:succinate--hydroxymethylglutarate CoA-transferase
MMLGDLGACVIKVESLKGDDTRRWGPPYLETESAYFMAVNRNKRSIAIDYKLGRDVILKLAACSDVLVENHLPGTLDMYGLGYADIAKVNPQIIYASITAFGPDGPSSTRLGYDLIIQAEAGLMSITGDSEPVKVGVAITDLTTGLYAKSAILAALLSRTKTGKGQKLDISLFDCQVASLANVGSNYLISGENGQRLGSKHPSIVPYQAFQTSNGDMVVAAANDAQFGRLCDALNRKDLIIDNQTNTQRVLNRNALVILADLVQRAKHGIPVKIYTRVDQDFGLIQGAMRSY